MKKAILPLFVASSIVFLFFRSKKEKIDWQELTNFKLFDAIKYEDFANSSEKELMSLHFKEIESDKVKSILSKFERNSKIWLWKGEKCALATFKNGKTVKLKISWYGGFIYDMHSKQGFILQNKNDVAVWQNLLSDSK